MARTPHWLASSLCLMACGANPGAGTLRSTSGTATSGGAESAASASSSTTASSTSSLSGGGTTTASSGGGTTGSTTTGGACTTPVLSVLDYGAKCDGSTDDSEALQSALDDAVAQVAMVHIPAGTCAHMASLFINGIEVYGDGPDATSLLATTPTGDAGAVIILGTNPALYNLSVIGTGQARSPQRADNGIYIDGADGYTVQNVHVKGPPGAGMMTEFGSNGKILNNFVEATGADGIYQTEATNNLEVAYNWTNATGDDGISFTSYDDAAGDVYQIDVHDNTVTGNLLSRGITVNGGDGITIEHNYVDQGTAGISVGATTEWGSLQDANITVQNNTIKDTVFTGEGTIGGGALHLYNNAGGTDTNILFQNNDVYEPAHDGIYVWGTDQIQATLSNNTFYMDQSHPLFVNDDSGATEITQSNNVQLAPASYPGDLVSPGQGLIPNFAVPCR